MAQKIIKKITFIIGLALPTLFHYKNTSDESASFTLCTANIIEGEIGCHSNQNSHSRIEFRKEGFCRIEDGDSYCPDNDTYNNLTLGCSMLGESVDEWGYTVYEWGYRYKIVEPNITLVTIHIAPGDTVSITGICREEYLTIEVPDNEHKAIYKNSDNPWISYRIIGKEITHRDDAIALALFVSATRFFTDEERGAIIIRGTPKYVEPKQEYYQRFLKKVNELKLTDLYEHFVDIYQITHDDIDRIRPMIQWWKLDALAYDRHISEKIWVEPFS